ncbi:hypothetical protein NW757_003710 [Fusarium falciforme]|nr:hypothetical protein NW757_003710 [Fusarium falciforme]
MRCLSPGAMSSEAPANIAINIGNVNLGPRATAILGMNSICSVSKAQEKTIEQCKDALFVSEPSSVRAELLNIKGNLTEGTCQWIRRNLEGLLDSDNEFFHGKEGMLIRSRWWDAYGEPVPSNFKKAGSLDFTLLHVCSALGLQPWTKKLLQDTVLARCQVDATDFNGWTPMWSSAGPGTVSAMKQAAAILQKNNVKVEKVSLPPEVADVEALGRIQKVITHGEARVSFLREYRVDKANLAAEIRDMVENTSSNTHKEMTGACDMHSKMRDMDNKLAENYTVILTPSAVDEAPLGIGDMGSPTFNTLWTGFYMPVINIPTFVGANDMPVGICLVGPRFRDQQLLRTSKVLGEVLLFHGGWKVPI